MSRTPDGLDKASKHCCGVDLQGIGGGETLGRVGVTSVDLGFRARRPSGVGVLAEFRYIQASL
jgi:hypothetical protein